MATRFGVYMPPDLAQELGKLVKVMGVGSRSRLLQEALRLFIAENRWSFAGNVVGTVTVLCRAKAVEDVDRVLHRFPEVVVSALHVPVDREKSVLVIAVRGSSERIKEFLKELHSTRRALLVRHILAPVSHIL